jgi:hypothetical protein
MANGVAMDDGHSILFLLSVHFSLSFESCLLAMLAMLMALCMSARILFCICSVVKHGSFPDLSLVVPAAHKVQPPALAPAPALQVQSAALLLPALAYEFVGQFIQVLDVAAGVMEYWPARQLMHEALPAAILYFPGTHAIHVAPSAPVYPGLQIQLVWLPLPAGDWELFVHAVHMLSPGMENVLAAHRWQSAIERPAVSGEKYPAPHGEHCITPKSGL